MKRGKLVQILDAHFSGTKKHPVLQVTMQEVKGKKQIVDMEYAMPSPPSKKKRKLIAKAERQMKNLSELIRAHDETLKKIEEME